MTSQPVEQRGVVREWRMDALHDLYVLGDPAEIIGRVDAMNEHNACVTALRAERADNARLREAFRRRVVHIPVPGDGYATCKECGSIWEPGTPEPHAPGCLAALGQEESK